MVPCGFPQVKCDASWARKCLCARCNDAGPGIQSPGRLGTSFEILNIVKLLFRMNLEKRRALSVGCDFDDCDDCANLGTKISTTAFLPLPPRKQPAHETARITKYPQEYT